MRWGREIDNEGQEDLKMVQDNVGWSDSNKIVMKTYHDYKSEVIIGRKMSEGEQGRIRPRRGHVDESRAIKASASRETDVE